MLPRNDSLQINVKGSLLRNQKAVKLLGITAGNELSFEPDLNKSCKKVSQKIMPLLEFQNLFKKKTETRYERIYISIFSLPLGMDIPQQNFE